MKNRTAFITGSSRGIGFSCAKKLIELKFNVIINSSNEEKCKEAYLRLKPIADLNNVKLLSVPGDISKLTTQDKIIETIFKHFNCLDVLVNNAGRGAMKRGDLLELSEESFDACLDLNTKALFFLSQKLGKTFLSDDKEHFIINITSCSAKILSPSRAEYCISKAAASMATQLLALRFAETKVKVFEIRPGIIKTDMTAPVTDKYNKLIAEGLVPNKEWGMPEDISKVVETIVTGGLPYCTGQIIDIDGGLHIQNF